jgi:methylase of polypeptide subunit release factors
MTSRSETETIRERTGNNLYPVTLSVQFGTHELELEVPEGVWNPTPHGIHLGETLATMDFSGEDVLELGTGCGLHAVVLARQGARSLSLTEIEQPILDNALHNLGSAGTDVPVDTQVADWTAVQGGPWDTLVTNPPFCKSGKRYRRYFIDTLVLDAHKLVKPGGRLVFIQSSMADVPRTLRLMDDCGMTTQVVAETSGPFRSYYFEDPVFLAEIARVPGSYEVRDGVHHERLTVLEATLP